MVCRCSPPSSLAGWLGLVGGLTAAARRQGSAGRGGTPPSEARTESQVHLQPAGEGQAERAVGGVPALHGGALDQLGWRLARHALDRKSTRLNSSHTVISYAVFCLKKKKKKKKKQNDKKKKKKQKPTKIKKREK